eukprot:7757434-Pyramimonas_sp.AAC.2
MLAWRCLCARVRCAFEVWGRRTAGSPVAPLPRPEVGDSPGKGAEAAAAGQERRRASTAADGRSPGWIRNREEG